MYKRVRGATTMPSMVYILEMLYIHTEMLYIYILLHIHFKILYTHAPTQHPSNCQFSRGCWEMPPAPKTKQPASGGDLTMRNTSGNRAYTTPKTTNKEQHTQHTRGRPTKNNKERVARRPPENKACCWYGSRNGGCGGCWCCCCRRRNCCC